MPDNDYTGLEPCNRFEAFLSGVDLDPSNREEYFIQQAVNRLPFPESGESGYVLAVNQDEDGYDLVEPSGGADLPDLTGNAGCVLTVNSGATDVEWSAPNYLPFPSNSDRGKVLGVKSNQNKYEFKTMPQGPTVLNFTYSGTTVSNFPDQAAFNVFQDILDGKDFIFMLSENGATHYITSRNVELKEVLNVKTVHVTFFTGIANGSLKGYTLLWSTDESTWESSATLIAF